MTNNNRSLSGSNRDPDKPTSSEELPFQCDLCKAPMNFGQNHCPACGYRRSTDVGKTFVHWMILLAAIVIILGAGIYLNGGFR